MQKDTVQSALQLLPSSLKLFEGKQLRLTLEKVTSANTLTANVTALTTFFFLQIHVFKNQY